MLLSELVELQFTLNTSQEDDALPSYLDIIAFITTPKLQRIQLSRCGPLCGTRANASLKELLVRSSCVVQSLDISLSWEDDQHADVPTTIHSFLLELSLNLEELSVVRDYSDAYVIDPSSILKPMLTAADTGKILFPRLKRLQHHDLALDPVLLGYLIQARQERSSEGNGRADALERVDVFGKPLPHLPELDETKNHYASALNTILSTSTISILCQVIFDPK